MTPWAARVRDVLAGLHWRAGDLGVCAGTWLLERAAGRLWLRCDRCGRVTPGWTLDAPPPRVRYAGLLSWRELAAARKRGVRPAVVPAWETRRRGRTRRPAAVGEGTR